jgi:capsular exopolysaccharide synthesis family protein
MVEKEQLQSAANKVLRPVTGAPVGAGALTPKEVYGILRRHMLLIISTTILGLVIGGVSWYLLRKYYPRYTAQTYIRVLPPLEKDPTTIEGSIVGKDLQYGYRLSMADLIKQQSTLVELLGRDKVKNTKWYRDFGQSETVRVQKAFEDLKKHFGAYASRDTEFVSISMTCCDRKEARYIVNEMADLFLDRQGSSKRGEIRIKLARLEEQRDRVQGDLADSEQALDDVRRASNLTDLEDRQIAHTITLKLNNLEIEQNDLMLQMKQLQSVVETLERQATGPINEQIENQIETDPIMVSLGQQLALRKAELASKMTKFGENHRVVREQRELINEINNRRQVRKGEIAEQTRQSNLQNAQDELVVLADRLAELERLRQETEAKQKDLDLARAQYEQRLAIRDEREERLNEVKRQISKLQIMLESPETPKVQLVGYAPEPMAMSFPRWQLFFPGGTMLGMLFGVGLTFLIELLNDLVRTPRDVARYLRIRLLGIIPHIVDDEQARGTDLYQITRLNPYSIISESYRRLRTNLKLTGSGAGKVLVVTSGGPEEGKTSVAVNLAAAFVAENKKVLLVDSNFRRPSLDTIFPYQGNDDKNTDAQDNLEVDGSEQTDNKKVFGLSTMLTGLCGYEEIIRPSGIEGLDVIGSGPVPTNPVELLGGPQMERLLKRQRENYDYIIIDSPPVLLVSDSKLLARVSDGVILVLNASCTHRGAAQRTIRELREAQANLIGCVLVAVRALKGGYFREQFRSYQRYQKLQLAHSV